MNKQQVDAFEGLQAQLKGLYDEMQTLAKKSPNNAVNKFKLGLINNVITKANVFLGKGQRPFNDFVEFGENDLPSNSDVLIILSQYLACLEKIRSDNVESYSGRWYWVVDGDRSGIQTSPPTSLC